MTTALKVVLVLVFGAAGIGKLTDRRGTREEVVAFGIPEPLAGFVAALLPFLELAAAVAIALPATAKWGAIGGLTLLVAYTAAIAVNLLLGRNPDCECFGPLLVTPIGWRPLVRNLILAGAAVLLITRL